MPRNLRKPKRLWMRTRTISRCKPDSLPVALAVVVVVVVVLVALAAPVAPVVLLPLVPASNPR